ncbi:MAG: hypothetical protein GWN84_10655 [Gammaproteobacteria bacterium]|nr:hypothetical protein [Gammaproteobacteria bacterium]NIR83325.1 hypothetical protein [Gammaproteobacteria bacterium]NIR91125.1 hypothetical protein [Gammaproteobacteria bacterium]NIU04492.1 hypothetical protein [Gammaproteobacteria bacterium]NIW87128.1 hypothetical protein [Gammaproteobacteria bacterium]
MILIVAEHMWPEGVGALFVIYACLVSAAATQGLLLQIRTERRAGKLGLVGTLSLLLLCALAASLTVLFVLLLLAGLGIVSVPAETAVPWRS